MIVLMTAAGITAVDAPLAYVVHDGPAAGPLARRVGEEVRDAGMRIVVNAGGGSMKSQMKRADASGAQVALIIGEEEAGLGTVAVKPLRGGGGGQSSVAAGDVVATLRALQR
jgi:histidyl-tRNA synthetase